jgi:hypothetical protein
MATCDWFDNNPVCLLSSSVNPVGPNSRALRYIGRRRYAFYISPIQVEYQEMMRGVDVVDQTRRSYSIQLKSRKWWHKILMFIVDSSLGNAYILYCTHCSSHGIKSMSRAEFHYHIAGVLTDPMIKVGCTCGLFNIQNKGIHYLAKADHKGYCLVCSSNYSRICPSCNGGYLCEGRCYLLVQTQSKWAAYILKKMRAK